MCGCWLRWVNSKSGPRAKYLEVPIDGECVMDEVVRN